MKTRLVSAKKVGVAMSVLVLAAALGACSSEGGDGPKSSEGDLITVNVGNLVYTGTAPFQLGIEKGFFEEEGLEIVQTEGDNPAAIAGQISSGQLDIGFATTTFLATVVAQGAELKAIAPVDGLIDTEAAAAAIVVPEDSDIMSAKDLAGKKVGVVALGSELHLLTLVVVDDDGGDSSAVEPVQLPFPQMQQALDAGNVDAIVTTEPFLSASLAAGGRSISTPEIEVFPNGTVTAWVTSNGFAEQNPDVIDGFRRAMEKTLQYSKDHKQEVLDLIPEYTGLEPDQVAETNLGTVYEPGLDTESITRMSELLFEYGFIETQPTLEELVYAAES
ncbi:ABC transporter substrate-binding protein [Okibacterium endophyticum]